MHQVWAYTLRSPGFCGLGSPELPGKDVWSSSWEITWRIHMEREKSPETTWREAEGRSSPLSPATSPLAQWLQPHSGPWWVRTAILPSWAQHRLQNRMVVSQDTTFGIVCCAAIEKWNRVLINILNQYFLLINIKCTHPPGDSDVALFFYTH